MNSMRYTGEGGGAGLVREKSVSDLLPRRPPADGPLSYQRPLPPNISDVLYKNEKLTYHKVDGGKRRDRQAARNLIKTGAYV